MDFIPDPDNLIDLASLRRELTDVRLSLPENAKFALQAIRRVLVVAQQEAGDFGGRAKGASGLLGGIGQVFGATTELGGKSQRAAALVALDRQLGDLDSGPVNVPAVRSAVEGAAREVNAVNIGNATLERAASQFNADVKTGLRDALAAVGDAAGAAARFTLSIVPWPVWVGIVATIGAVVYFGVIRK